ncbi:filament integrity protein fraC [Chlorogloeopsis sp. ULAP01]|uniref:filament integrity protein FraC n=1 Tax=Chlorogloeopsis sp. ULAP01 TaxID=3056483 RepID=UPI0025AB39E1|nr:filament integrity protein FraC [Chlorogloeopsis sp. ULAP01]MDM9384800.1 filament integrity protein fraC [Chlorogloeopsis sp. ULAP01]
MFDYPMIPEVIPLGAILFNFLFILIAIPIEAYILNRRLKFDKRTSSYYAIAINLFSNAIGWIIFFFLEPFLAVQLKSELISYIFFHRFISFNIQTIIILTAFIIFFSTFFIKVLLLRFLLLSLSDFKKIEPVNINKRRNSRQDNKLKIQNTNLVTAVLIANALSYSAISLILFLIPRQV